MRQIAQMVQQDREGAGDGEAGGGGDGEGYNKHRNKPIRPPASQNAILRCGPQAYTHAPWCSLTIRNVLQDDIY